MHVTHALAAGRQRDQERFHQERSRAVEKEIVALLVLREKHSPKDKKKKKSSAVDLYFYYVLILLACS